MQCSDLLPICCFALSSEYRISCVDPRSNTQAPHHTCFGSLESTSAQLLLNYAGGRPHSCLRLQNTAAPLSCGQEASQ
eukprot:2687020-Amphidinium_carterae.1